MKFAVLDLETTGEQPGRDDIIQVGLTVVNDLQIEHTYASFVRPNGPIPAFIRQLTGITDEMVADAPEIDDVMNDIVPLLDGAVLVAHNAAFDLAFLRRALADAGYPGYDGRVLDTLDWLRMLFPTLSSYQLSYVTQAFGIAHDRPHQADSDAEATAELWIRCLQKLFALPLMTLQRLGFLFAHPDATSPDNAWFLEEIVAWRAGDPGAESEPSKSHRQFALAVDDWTGDEETDREPVELEFEAYKEELRRRIRERMPDYEDRPAQDRMMDEVASSLEGERHLVIEAGTGTGKSLGYLVPSVHYALRHGEKVVVSTHTINLQEQLRQKELPMLHELSPIPFKSAVLKGRSHYLCLRKFEGKVNLQDFPNAKEDRAIAAQMVVWLGETQHGDEEELNLGQKGGEFWGHVASDADSCLNRACPWFRKCFYHRARNEAAAADVVVTNHSLLFTDVKAEHRILPAYGRLVVDEAHHFEDVASQHLGVELSYFSMVGALTTLLKDSRTGQLPLLKSLMEQHPNAKTEGWGAKIGELFPDIVQAKEMWDELFDALYDRFVSRAAAGQTEGGAVSVRLKTDQLPHDWNVFVGMEDNFFLTITKVLKVLDRLVTEGKEDAEDFGMESLFTDLSGTVKDVYRARDSLRLLLKADDPNMVYWLEATPQFKSRSLRLYGAPIDVSALMREYFWERKDAVVMTSATLTVEKSFQYVKAQLGLSDLDEAEEKLQTLQLPSPFKYRDQALVLIPRDFPGLKGANADPVFLERLVESLRDAAVVTHGKMLVLFTSHKMLKQTHGPLRDALQPHGIHVLGQGVDSGNRSKLTRLFMQAGAAVLLGTSSFWEGVDIPGEALTCLAIVRLPFQPPNHPMVEAKSEYLRAQGENPFTKLSVPQAVIRFKQGFGRLVRTAKDRGIVLVFDTRVIETSYGKHFLYSLPGPKIEHLPSETIPSRMREWLEASGSSGKGEAT
ncbi:ATP-dependent DNA helicase DinG [Paenibacillus sp.]|uniref:ATP-dependent DNA helicase DinG n=1 Tax=Paenibacillus sp. TaxID=58172 RepID=UPI002D68BEE1|nr:ATP-dependent DNA helicase DinG [Paenibacillus sp.]HZG55089.1 ATP-dependent DNA helicase DinG [Paenibacillus sp.]